MKIGIYKIVSSLHDQEYISKNTNDFISNIENELGSKIDFIYKIFLKFLTYV